MTAEVRSHTYDGIQEFDNRLPNWWLWTFYGACIFSVFFWIHYHTIGTGDLPGEAYLVEQRKAAAALEAEMKKNPVTEERLLQLAENPTFVADGKALFVQHCSTCHRENGGAGKDQFGTPGAGANLTDDYWIYGGDPMAIYQTILEGRQFPDPEIGSNGGMQSWRHLGTGSVLRLAAFVLSIKGSNVSDGKAPEKYAKKQAK